MLPFLKYNMNVTQVPNEVSVTCCCFFFINPVKNHLQEFIAAIISQKWDYSLNRFITGLHTSEHTDRLFRLCDKPHKHVLTQEKNCVYRGNMQHPNSTHIFREKYVTIKKN